MSEFTHFNNLKLAFASRVQLCRILIEELPIGQIIVDENGVIRSIDHSTQSVLGYEHVVGKRLSEFLLDGDAVFPKRLSPMSYRDLGEMTFLSKDETRYPAKVVCVPGPHAQTFLLSLIFKSCQEAVGEVEVK